LYEKHPDLAFDITWLAAREEQMLDEHLLSVGRRSASERAAYLLAFLFERAGTVSLFSKKSRIAPLTQQHVADTLGLSLVHTNKTLRKLSNRGAIDWQDSGFEIRDIDQLKEMAGWEGLPEIARPFI
jgi:CRP-like cAMP-binding protein